MLLRAVFRNTVMNISLCNALLCRESAACGLSGRPIIGRRQGWRPRHPPRVRWGICRSTNAPSLLCVRELRGLREYRKQLFVGGISRCNLHGRMSRLLGLYATSCFPLGRALPCGNRGRCSASVRRRASKNSASGALCARQPQLEGAHLGPE